MIISAVFACDRLREANMIEQIPQEVQREIDVLEMYTESDALIEFHILHLYPEGISFPNGYYDSRFFNLIGFNTATMQKRNLGRHDGINFEGMIEINSTRIFADGSTLLKFRKPIYISSITQAITFWNKNLK